MSDIMPQSMSTEHATFDVGQVQFFSSRRCRWLFLFVSLVILRLFLPFAATDMLFAHEQIVNSLLAGQNWGRQAFIGSLEFPPLTSLGLLVAGSIGRLLRIDAGKILVSFAQAWIFCYFLRAASAFSRRVISLLLLGVLFAVPASRELLVAVDPNWIVAVPAAAAIYHITQWRRSRSLRDAIICAVNCGFLAFAGIAAVVFALSILGMMCHDLRRIDAIPKSQRQGTKLLIWAPFVYCFLLWLLWNWLIMGDMFFPLRRLFQAIASTDPGALSTGMSAALKEVSPVAFGAAIVLSFSVYSRAYVTATCLLSALIAILLFNLFFEAVSVYGPAAELLLLLLSLAGLLTPLLLLDWSENKYRQILAVVIISCSVSVSFAGSRSSYFARTAFIQPYPPREALANWVDQFWMQARISIYGVRAGAIYHDLDERRFIAHLDFQESRLLEQAEREQLHILLPPRDGVFYASEHGPLSEMHLQGKPWLLLERRWPGGWQLWRVIIPPAGESKLQQYE